MSTTTLSTELHAAYKWTEAAGELDELASLKGDVLVAYAAQSEVNAIENDVTDVHASDLVELAAWLRARAV